MSSKKIKGTFYVLQGQNIELDSLLTIFKNLISFDSPTQVGDMNWPPHNPFVSLTLFFIEKEEHTLCYVVKNFSNFEFKEVHNGILLIFKEKAEQIISLLKEENINVLIKQEKIFETPYLNN